MLTSFSLLQPTSNPSQSPTGSPTGSNGFCVPTVSLWCCFFFVSNVPPLFRFTKQIPYIHTTFHHAQFIPEEDSEGDSSEGDPCLCGVCDESDVCQYESGGSRPSFYALKFTGNPEAAPPAISVSLKGKAGCNFLDISPEQDLLDDRIYFINAAPGCVGSGGDLKVFNGTDLSGVQIGNLHISCSEILFVGMTFETQPSGQGDWTLVGACFAEKKRKNEPFVTPQCLGQCEGIIPEEGACTEPLPWVTRKLSNSNTDSLLRKALSSEGDELEGDNMELSLNGVTKKTSSVIFPFALMMMLYYQWN